LTTTRPDSLRTLLVDAHIEVMPLNGIEEQLQHLAPGSTVTVTCSPSKGVDATLKLAAWLGSQGFNAVPHLAARQIANKQQLKEILIRLKDSGVSSIFVPGGDVSPPTGDFDSALQLLQAMSEIDHGIERIGVAAYPEGHPFIDDTTLIDALRDKQQFATSCVTQMCFHAEAITDWIESIRNEGIDLPVRIGMPGAVERKKLFTFSLKIGVGDSARALIKQSNVVRKLMAAKTYQPDELVSHLADYVGDERFDIAGLHLYTFNQVRATNDWRESFIKKGR
jgi:methylenetetrahydrofolate reductase (NADPH)